MTINRMNFDDISEADLQSLIDTGVPEGIAIDYKAALYAGNDEGVREFLKDLSSFANTAGGHLIIGVTEDNLLPTGFSPLSIDADLEIQRLESRARDGITPRIPGIRMRAIPVQGGVVIVIRVPRSWTQPHQVTARNSRRFYVRNSSGCHEMSVDELRAAFNLAGSAQQQTRALRHTRLVEIRYSRTPLLLPQDGDGKLILHIVPFAIFGSQPAVDLVTAYQLTSDLMPIGVRGTTPHYNFEGLLNEAGGDPCLAYCQLFREGWIESVRAGTIIRFGNPVRRYIPTRAVTNDIIDAVPRYLRALQALEVPPPFTVMVTLDGVAGTLLGVDDRHSAYEEPHPIRLDALEFPEVLIEDYGSHQSYLRAMKPVFDALWNAGGFARSPL